ncbi:D-methionine transport system substrate-binding protein [Haloactinopolyspora alba]|uniref:Lipoprotein n=1 Tax=Haloactinopolyspora alba TaxID=648780 RepID=A0A2P8DPR4_9ACTN|nr:MetQ/NlpA family ABC transporter substrate-binding protein [Haloactinopolyspora alba]PSK99181.1 D-methionine transport system substrate-binding protein [Haloactinopolyspora alba]
MKRTTIAVAGLASAVLLAGCGADDGSSAGDGVVRVGVTPVPHGEIMQFVQDELAEDAGIELELVEFTDYVQPNVALSEGELDANFFQHVPYLDAQEADRGYDFEAVTPVHLEPLGMYSTKIDSLSQLSSGAQVIIPNDPSNSGRALNLLADEGLIELADDAGISATRQDIVDDGGLEIEELEAASLPRSLPDADLAVINTNYALEADLAPGEDALAMESAEDNPYANVLVVPTGSENSESISTLADLLTSEEVVRFIEENYDGAIVPAA